MSFILDALRKSEHERQRSALPGLSHVPLATPSPGLPRWAIVVIGSLAAAVLVLGGAWWQSTRAPADVAAPLATVERPVTLPPAPTTSEQPANPVVERAATPRASEPASGGASALANAAAPAAQPVPGEASFSPPADPQPAPAADEPVLPSAAALLAQGIVVPPLHLELLRYREQAQDRFVFINGRKYVEGERLVEGPQVVSIVPAGAVLAHAGRRFMLVSE